MFLCCSLARSLLRVAIVFALEYQTTFLETNFKLASGGLLSVKCLTVNNTESLEPQVAILVLPGDFAALAIEAQLAVNRLASSLIESLATSNWRNVNVQTRGRLVWIWILNSMEANFV